MKIDKYFYNDQYKKNQESKYIFDHSWYKYFLKYAKWRNHIVADYFLKYLTKNDLKILDLWCWSWWLYDLIKWW